MDRIPVSSRMHDITGQRFGMLVAQYPVKSKRPTDWFCICDCGGTKAVRADQLKSCNNKSCGCQLYIAKTKPRHGLSHTKIHRCWLSIKTRCYNEKHDRYHRYGGRGIRVCQRWLDSFEAFLKDMGMPPSPEHSIDRIDNNGDYSPENCRWATRIEQANNKS